MTILDPRLWLAFIVALAVTAGTCYFAGHKAGVRTATAAAQKAQLAAVDAARTEEQRRTAAQSEIAKDANQQRTAALADAFAARAAAGSLQQRVDQLVAAARYPAAAAGSPAAGDALDLLADVLGRADQRAGDLAEYADRARIAGQQCERDYDALITAAR
ncbi:MULTISPECIES: DUF2514 family protein [Burkholderia]|uniref:DUF2514 family protein n=1 Tax=Burkholderia TaxID=32008 RepID=UPI000B79DA79|nr:MULTISPECIES: DUF2514 family protein [Burkholderia]MBY4725197.1 DUF2514 domain-containing protein [Burkholderia contaminans]MCI3970789.1 DUF2514 domain-containing protein [Burkholderia sp. HI4860]OXJ04459.1 hypothetical protein CFB48_06825 [Burkholderia sp. AU33647]